MSEREKGASVLGVSVLLGLLFLAIVIAALSGLPTSWDGPAYLWLTLDSQTFFVPNRRFINIPLELPVLLASALTADPFLLETVFGLAFAAIPLVALLACVWVVGPRSPLLVWPALAIGFGTLVGQSNATSEAIAAVQLFWPALLATLIGHPVARSLVAVGLAAISVVGHPFAIAALAACALVALLRRERGWTVFFGALTLAAVARLIWFSVPYERSLLGGSALGTALPHAIGPHLIGWMLAVAAAAVLVAQARFAGHARGRWLGMAAPALALCAVAAFALWAAAPHSLVQSFYIRTLLPMAVGVFGVLAVFDLWTRRFPLSDGSHRTRALIVGLCGVSLLVTLGLQSVHWAGYRDSLRASLAAAGGECVPLESVPHMPGMGSCAFWTETFYSLAIQGRTAQRIALPQAACATALQGEAIPVSFQHNRRFGTGWYDLEALRRPVAP